VPGCCRRAALPAHASACRPASRPHAWRGAQAAAGVPQAEAGPARERQLLGHRGGPRSDQSAPCRGGRARGRRPRLLLQRRRALPGAPHRSPAPRRRAASASSEPSRALQDFLQQHNQAPSPAGRPEPASLWDTWLERETTGGPQPNAAAGEAGGREADPGWLSAGGGLFGDARPSSGAAARLAPAPRHLQPERGGDGAVPAAAPEAPQRADASDSPPADASAEPDSGRGSRRREDSRSMVGSLLSAVGRSVAAWLPPALRRVLDTRSERGSEEGADADREDDGDAREQARGPARVRSRSGPARGMLGARARRCG